MSSHDVLCFTPTHLDYMRRCHPYSATYGHINTGFESDASLIFSIFTFLFYHLKMYATSCRIYFRRPQPKLQTGWLILKPALVCFISKITNTHFLYDTLAYSIRHIRHLYAAHFAWFIIRASYLISISFTYWIAIFIQINLHAYKWAILHATLATHTCNTYYTY